MLNDVVTGLIDTYSNENDLHILRYFSSYITVADKQVVNVTDPTLKACPLAGYLYKDFKSIDNTDKESLKQVIKRIIEDKIREYGFFTEKRNLLSTDITVPYGASEMIMMALNNKAVDAAVIVCDGAGTVVTNKGDVVQGIGARMNSLFYTSPIKDTIKRLKQSGSDVVFANARIDQFKGVEKAIQNGYRKIVVTINASDAEKIGEIRKLESSSGTAVTVLVVCTTGITGMEIDMIRRYADIVWSCASWDIRNNVGAVSLLQVSKQIPLFVLTPNGIKFISAYSDNESLFLEEDKQKQYLISNEPIGKNIKMGNFNSYLREEKLPVFPKRNNFV